MKIKMGKLKNCGALHLLRRNMWFRWAPSILRLGTVYWSCIFVEKMDGRATGACHHAQQKRMNIFVVTEVGRLLVVVGPTETVLEVKQRLELILGVPTASQALSIYGIELIDGFELEFYDVYEGMQIDLDVAPEGMYKFQICIKISTRQISLEVKGLDTVAYLKERIQIEDGTPIERLTLFYSGTKMEDARCLGDYGIVEHSEIIAIIKPIPRLKAVPPPRRLRFVVQTTSSFNSMNIPVEMNDSSSVSEVRQVLLGRGLLPPDDYFFIHKQRIMKDDQSLRRHGVRNGDSLHVFNGTVSNGRD
ncbi:uncharacterized protein LOC131239926 [Magnolia sinica]|uniref:uncharacterized protein LOC131239926 n=1 Tax=Magnolia sinica TaxID=86752 RepID=UPI00265AB795|nr:uncharacterized protein LOC131239926 [Magnolia sinica]